MLTINAWMVTLNDPESTINHFLSANSGSNPPNRGSKALPI